VRVDIVADLYVDGGGIRGYGSLLILQDLMNKIGDYEKTLDTTESSFAPCDYRPTTKQPTGSTDSSPTSQFEVPDPDAVVATPSHELSNSSLFLPCHYFNYAAGTSTGGQAYSLAASAMSLIVH
jgi:hypothetical protein